MGRGGALQLPQESPRHLLANLLKELLFSKSVLTAGPSLHEVLTDQRAVLGDRRQPGWDGGLPAYVRAVKKLQGDREVVAKERDVVGVVGVDYRGELGPVNLTEVGVVPIQQMGGSRVVGVRVLVGRDHGERVLLPERLPGPQESQREGLGGGGRLVRGVLKVPITSRDVVSVLGLLRKEVELLGYELQVVRAGLAIEVSVARGVGFITRENADPLDIARLDDVMDDEVGDQNPVRDNDDCAGLLRVGGVVVQHRPSGVIKRIELVGGEVRLLEKDDVVGVGEREDELKRAFRRSTESQCVV